MLTKVFKKSILPTKNMLKLGKSTRRRLNIERDSFREGRFLSSTHPQHTQPAHTTSLLKLRPFVALDSWKILFE